MTATKIVGNGFDFQNAARITNLPDAASAQEPATYAQLQAAVQGLSWKNPVRAAATGNLTLSGTQTVDGVALVANDRVLAPAQTTASTNGIYVVQSGAWVRATDADTESELVNAAVFVSEGTTNADKQFVCTTNAPITVGTTSLTWVQISSGTSYTAGTGISIASNIISIDTSVTARKGSATIGDGSSTSFNITHNLGSTTLMWSCREVGGGKAYVIPDVVYTDTNTLTVTFATAPTSGQYLFSVAG